AESLAALPPALHPSIPGHISLLIVRGADSLLGPFSLAQVRIGCRAGIKPRGFCLGAVTDSAVVADALSSRWGFRCRFGAIALSKRYHRVSVHAELEGAPLFDLVLSGIQSLADTTVAYPPTLNGAATPLGPRLVQVDTDVEFTRVDRAVPALHHFDTSPWGYVLHPQQSVAATSTTGTMVIHPVRYVCQLDIPAADGTERVDPYLLEPVAAL